MPKKPQTKPAPQQLTVKIPQRTNTIHSVLKPLTLHMISQKEHKNACRNLTNSKSFQTWIRQKIKQYVRAVLLP